MPKKKTHLPLVSIIIPVHDTEVYLRECLDSVLRQSYKNIEIILIDDDSTDGSTDILKEHARNHERVRYYFVKKHSAALARRVGIVESKADLVCFVDSDDVIGADYVQSLHDVLVENDLEVSSAKVIAFSDELPVLKSKKTPNLTIECDLVGYYFNNYRLDSSGGYISQSINAKLFKKSALKNIEYDVLKTNVLEDNFIAVQILNNLTIKKVGMLDKIVYYYRQNPKSTMGMALNQMVPYEGRSIEYTELFEILTKYITKVFSFSRGIDKYVLRMRVEEYRILAKQVVAKNIHISNLELIIEDLKSENIRISYEYEKITQELKSVYASSSWALVMKLRNFLQISGLSRIIRKTTRPNSSS